MSTRYSNPQPYKHELSPITTRPGNNSFQIVPLQTSSPFNKELYGWTIQRSMLALVGLLLNLKWRRHIETGTKRGPKLSKSWLWMQRQSFFKNGPTPASFFVYIPSFQTKIITIFTTNICEKCPSSIQYRDLNPRPLERVSSHNH